MRVVLAPDKFKGSATAAQVAAALRAGLLRAAPGLDVVSVPMADGGEGTVDAALAAGHCPRTVTVSGPLGEPVEARFAVSPDGGTAVVEMAAASGLALVGASDAAARHASTRGTGELIRAALDAGARRIVVGAGGSASTDGGAGMLAALGARLVDHEGAPISDGGAALGLLADVELGGLDPRLRDVELVLASDVDNPLLGGQGAAAVFGPQKGADPSTVAELDAGLARWTRRLDAAGVPDAVGHAARPGAGAAGGLGYGLLVLGATRRPGVETVLALTGFARHLSGATLVVTGEGSLDEQSLGGKTPVGVAAAAADAGVPVVAVAGRSTLDAAQLRTAGFAAVHSLTDREPDVDVCITDATRLLHDVGEHIARDLQERP